MIKRYLMALILVIGFPLAACAQEDSPKFVAGEQYTVLETPIRTANPDKIEVTEFFWYGCGHCYNFEPVISQWKKKLPDDVVFVGSPAMWNKPMEVHAQAYYTAEVLGVLERMHPVLFQAMHVDRKPLTSESELADLFAAHGVEREAFSKAFNSFGVGSMVRQANSRARAARVTGTPEMMVNGKYRVDSRKAGGQAGMLEVVDFLIEKERAARES